MKKIGILVHGGASSVTSFMRHHDKDYAHGLQLAVERGFHILEKGGTAIDAIMEAVVILEDDPFFNAGRGSALNCNGEVEMDASIMDGKTLHAGAVSMVRRVKNPILIAKAVMEETHHVMLSGYGALEFAKQKKLTLKDQRYFITPYQVEELKQAKKAKSKLMSKPKSGTVGAVALDKKGNLAAATSTGGTSMSMPGRIGDSCIIGAGCYANNKSCAISGTGVGELLIEGVVAHTISMLIELKKMSLQQACDYVLHQRNKHVKGDIGVIGISPKGEFGMAFNCESMKRAWKSSNSPLKIKLW